MPYPTLTGPLTITPAEFSNRQLAGGDWSAARLFQQQGRYFELAVIYGDKHPSASAVQRLNQILSTLQIKPSTRAPARLLPPTFDPAPAWHTGNNPPIPTEPQGDQLCAWASMIRYQDTNTYPIPGRTILALRPGQMVISVDAYRNWEQPLNGRLPQHLIVPPHLTTQAEGGYQSADIQGTANTGYTVEIDVYVGHNQPFTRTMRQQAQQEIDRLHLPHWPPPSITVS